MLYYVYNEKATKTQPVRRNPGKADVSRPSCKV
jgi:hypothetical protein